MTNATVVIGAGYGDEGKGRTVDFICQSIKSDSILGVRFNGGAQASHTVFRNGKVHAYSHFSSTTAQGHATYLDEKFILNPFVFKQEWNELVEKDINPPKVFVHEKCIVTHVYDMIYNQHTEKNNIIKHGTCGLGINNTVNRNTLNVGFDGFTIKYIKDFDPTPMNIANRVLSYYPIFTYQHINDPQLALQWGDDLQFMMNHIEIVSEMNYNNYDHVIFEGAQGLQLDEDSVNFPHVTHSKTGLFNIKETLTMFKNVEVIYVTRCYQTKHGAGPFENEADLSMFFDIVDKTNVPNPWQGELRTAALDTAKLIRTINHDIMVNPIYGKNVNYSIAITCLDQMKNGIIPIQNGNIIKWIDDITGGNAFKAFFILAGFYNIYDFYNPSNEDLTYTIN